MNEEKSGDVFEQHLAARHYLPTHPIEQGPHRYVGDPNSPRRVLVVGNGKEWTEFWHRGERFRKGDLVVARVWTTGRWRMREVVNVGSEHVAMRDADGHENKVTHCLAFHAIESGDWIRRAAIGEANDGDHDNYCDKCGAHWRYGKEAADSCVGGACLGHQAVAIVREDSDGKRYPVAECEGTKLKHVRHYGRTLLVNGGIETPQVVDAINQFGCQSAERGFKVDITERECGMMVYNRVRPPPTQEQIIRFNAEQEVRVKRAQLAGIVLTTDCPGCGEEIEGKADAAEACASCKDKPKAELPETFTIRAPVHFPDGFEEYEEACSTPVTSDMVDQSAIAGLEETAAKSLLNEADMIDMDRVLKNAMEEVRRITWEMEHGDGLPRTVNRPGWTPPLKEEEQPHLRQLSGGVDWGWVDTCVKDQD